MDFVAVGTLVVLGAALGTRRVVQVKKDWIEAPCLWVAIVGRPGDAKSPALDQALFPVREAEAEAYLAYQRELKTWEDWDDGGGPRPDRPVRDRFAVSDVTVEKLALVLQENPRGVLLHRDEFGGWIRSMNLYRGGRGADVENFNSIWSGSSWRRVARTASWIASCWSTHGRSSASGPTRRSASRRDWRT